MPRLVNQICDYELVYAFTDGLDKVDAGVIEHEARGRWRVLDDEEEGKPLSEHTTATDAEREAWRLGARSVLVRDRYGRTHNAMPITGSRFRQR